MSPTAPPPRPAAGPPPVGRVGATGVGASVAAPDGRARADTPPTSQATGAAPPAELRLVIGREGLGIELAEGARIGPAQVVALAVAVGGVKFPLDVSGGVARFRHRRGRLVRVELEARAAEVAAWAAPRLRGVLGPRTPEVWVAPRRGGATVAIAERDDDRDDATASHGRGSRPSLPGTGEGASARAIAFELALEVTGDDVRLTVHDARGLALHGPATAIAIAAVTAALGDAGEREGSAFVVRSAAAGIARRLLPDAGVRAPSCEGIAWSSVAAHGDTWILHAIAGAPTAAPEEEAVRARELAALTRTADDARVRGDLDRARALDLAALERAPRHREIARRIAEIDCTVGGRAEAARSMLEEASGAGRARDGVLLGELALEAGDVDAALAAFARAGEIEEAPALAARALERAAALARDPADALDWLDRAVARAPALARTRWARVARRLEAGRLEGALADVEHLEAQAHGARAKHLVWRRAGAAWRRAGARGDAGILFERALRFVPDEPSSLAGLGAALVAEGRAARGVALLSRALELAEERDLPTSGTALELARALAERLDDLPAAIARARSVPATDPAALEARALEGRWRARLGDLAGASLAFVRARDASQSLASPDARVPLPEARSSTDADADAAWLLEATAFERDVRVDLLAAQRHLAAALRLAPRHPGAREAYRAIGARLSPPLDSPAPPPTATTPAAPAVAPAPAEPPGRERAAALAALRDAEEPTGDGADNARVEELTRRLQLDPTDDHVADELTRLLTKLGRSHELLALLIARLEDSTPARREVLRSPTRAVLERLADDAAACGRADEAQLFRDTIGMLGL